MKSTIRIDFTDNGNGLEPIIKIVIEDTDDPRDSLIRTFFQKLGGQSSWLRVDFHNGTEIKANKYISVYPITPNELKGTMEDIKNRISVPI